MCEHLDILENYLIEKGIVETFRGQSWSNNCREWIYYKCVLSTEKLKNKLKLNDCVKTHEYIDIKIANELGLVCTICHDGIMGLNPKSPLTTNEIVVD
ncbi:MAG: hypothetical protein ACK4S0_03225 [Sediminibacterium sp.]